MFQEYLYRSPTDDTFSLTYQRSNWQILMSLDDMDTLYISGGALSEMLSYQVLVVGKFDRYFQRGVSISSPDPSLDLFAYFNILAAREGSDSVNGNQVVAVMCITSYEALLSPDHPLRFH